MHPTHFMQGVSHFQASHTFNRLGCQPKNYITCDNLKPKTRALGLCAECDGNYDLRLMPDNGKIIGMSAKADLRSLTTKHAETGCDQVNHEPPSPNSQDASIRSPSRSGSSVPYPFDSQSSLENENGSHRMYHNTVETHVKQLTR